MIRKRLKKNSIVSRLGALMLSVILLHSVLYLSVIFVMDVPGTLRSYAYDSFSASVEARASFLRTEMLDRWRNINDYNRRVTELYNTYFFDVEPLSATETVTFLTNSVPAVSDMLISSLTTGAFIILDDSGGDPKVSNSALYIINGNPSNSLSAGSDIQLLFGPSDIASTYQIPLSENWTYGFYMDIAYTDILYKPFEAVPHTDVDAYRGYWHMGPSFTNDDEMILTYSLPLVDKYDRIYGVIGIEMNQSYLSDTMPSSELGSDDAYGYMFATQDEATGDLIPLMSLASSDDRDCIPMGVPMSLRDEADGLYYDSPESGAMAVYSVPLELYANNTPFEKTDLYFVALVPESHITGFANSLSATLIATAAFSLLLAVTISLMIGYLFSRPVMKLSASVRNGEPGTIVSLERTGILEVDELAHSIEEFHRNTLERVSKDNTLLSLMDLGVGTYEHVEGSDLALVSFSLQKMLGLRHVEYSPFHVEKTKLLHALHEMRQFPEPGFQDAFALSSTPDMWLRISETVHNNVFLGVVIDVTKDVLERRAINYELEHDTLTGIGNRFSFHKDSHAILEAGDVDTAAVAMFDLDNLKYVNDTFGHELGDEYIKLAARCLDEELSDSAVVARMSGDEFFVFLHNFPSKAAILDKLKLFYQRLEHTPLILKNGVEFKVRMSGGVAWHGSDSKDFDELIRYADFAMYEGKHTLKGELRIFNKQVYDAQSFMLSGKEELNRILDNHFIDFAFQPIISAHSGKLYAYEALMRPQSEILNTPLKLLQLATAQSQLWKVERITFFKALSTYKKYEAMFDGCKLFINSVPNEKLKPTEYDELERLYSDCLPSIVVEIIENERLDSTIMDLKLSRFSSWGSDIALDDYGSGYNSDLSLLNLRPKIVKIDRDIIQKVDSDPSRQALFAKIMSYCKDQGVLVLAEGVETLEQLHYLVGRGVDFLQGYFIQRPMELPNFDTRETEALINDIKSSLTSAQK